MNDTQRYNLGRTLCALGAMWLVVVMVGGFNVGDVVGLVVVWTSLGGLLLWRRWRIRRAVHALRSLTHDDRVAALRAIGDDPARIYLEFELQEHGAPEVDGPVQRFAVSPVDRREQAIVAYGCVGVAIVSAAIPFIVIMATVQRVAVWTLACASGLVSVWLLARCRWFSQSYEVSAFGLRAVAPYAQARMLRWIDGVHVANRPRRGYVEFRSMVDSTTIQVPYRVVGFQSLVNVLAERLRHHQGDAQ